MGVVRRCTSVEDVKEKGRKEEGLVFCIPYFAISLHDITTYMNTRLEYTRRGGGGRSSAYSARVFRKKRGMGKACRLHCHLSCIDRREMESLDMCLYIVKILVVSMADLL